MSVVSSSSKVIFCEGKENSLDYLLLNLLLNDLLDKPTIVPSGGKFSFSTFAQGYFSNNQTQNQRYIVFRDRDFDANPTDEIQLLPLLNNNHTFLRGCLKSQNRSQNCHTERSDSVVKYPKIEVLKDYLQSLW